MGQTQQILEAINGQLSARVMRSYAAFVHGMAQVQSLKSELVVTAMLARTARKQLARVQRQATPNLSHSPILYHMSHRKTKSHTAPFSFHMSHSHSLHMSHFALFFPMQHRHGVLVLCPLEGVWGSHITGTRTRDPYPSFVFGSDMVEPGLTVISKLRRQRALKQLRALSRGLHSFRSDVHALLSRVGVCHEAQQRGVDACLEQGCGVQV